jgi:hypothetical protein
MSMLGVPCTMAVMTHYHEDGWYHEAHMESGAATHLQATSLQAFWPGMQAGPGRNCSKCPYTF